MTTSLITMKMNSLFRAGFVLAAATAFAAGAWAADAAAGKTTYSARCASCHKADGSGNAAIGKAFGVELKPLGSADVQKKSDDDLKANILQGVGKMKPVALSPGDADNVVAYIRTLKQ